MKNRIIDKSLEDFNRLDKLPIRQAQYIHRLEGINKYIMETIKYSERKELIRKARK